MFFHLLANISRGPIFRKLVEGRIFRRRDFCRFQVSGSGFGSLLSLNELFFVINKRKTVFPKPWNNMDTLSHDATLMTDQNPGKKQNENAVMMKNFPGLEKKNISNFFSFATDSDNSEIII